jgi:hypothetical protein
VAIGGLLVATALLVAGQPATEPQLVDAGPAANHGPVARQVADLEETVGLKPNRAGSSVVLVDVFDRRRPAPGPISDVAVRIGDRALGSARSLGNGHWSVPVSDLEGGRTAVTITVTRAGAEPVTATYPWVVGASTPHPDVVVSRAPATSALRLLAGAFGVVAVGAAVVARRRRPRPRAVVPAAEPEKETVS